MGTDVREPQPPVGQQSVGALNKKMKKETNDRGRARNPACVKCCKKWVRDRIPPECFLSATSSSARCLRCRTHVCHSLPPDVNTRFMAWASGTPFQDTDVAWLTGELARLEAEIKASGLKSKAATPDTAASAQKGKGDEAPEAPRDLGPDQFLQPQSSNHPDFALQFVDPLLHPAIPPTHPPPPSRNPARKRSRPSSYTDQQMTPARSESSEREYNNATKKQKQKTSKASPDPGFEDAYYELRCQAADLREKGKALLEKATQLDDTAKKIRNLGEALAEGE